MQYTNENVAIRFEGGIEIGRPWLAADERRAQRVLSKHRSEGVQCLCTPFGVPMHVVCRDGRFHLASNPGRASHHALSCPSYLPSEDTSGLRHYSDTAIGRAAGRHKLVVAPQRPACPPFDHFSPGAALQFIWEFAGLNVCTPKTVARRTHLGVSRSLHAVGSQLRINDRSLRLYLPNVVPEVDDCLFAIGQVYSTFTGKYANGLKLSGNPKNTFWITQKQWSATDLTQHLGPYDSPELSTTHWLIGKLWQSPGGNWRLYDIGMLPVSDQLLPVPQGGNLLLNKLVEAKRRFFVCQKFDALDDDTIPLAVLIDRKEPQIVPYPLLDS